MPYVRPIGIPGTNKESVGEDMTLIKKLVDMIEEEIEGAEEYAECAVKWKDDKASLAKTLYDISADELRHIDMLHGEVVKIIEEHRRTHGEPPASMLAIWDYMHERHIKHVNEIKMLHNQYRGV
jgi:rubrerythrin